MLVSHVHARSPSPSYAHPSRPRAPPLSARNLVSVAPISIRPPRPAPRAPRAPRAPAPPRARSVRRTPRQHPQGMPAQAVVIEHVHDRPEDPAQLAARHPRHRSRGHRLDARVEPRGCPGGCDRPEGRRRSASVTGPGCRQPGSRLVERSESQPLDGESLIFEAESPLRSMCARSHSTSRSVPCHTNPGMFRVREMASPISSPKTARRTAEI